MKTNLFKKLRSVHYFTSTIQQLFGTGMPLKCKKSAFSEVFTVSGLTYPLLMEDGVRGGLSIYRLFLKEGLMGGKGRGGEGKGGGKLVENSFRTNIRGYRLSCHHFKRKPKQYFK